jgi:hypothetical protein
MSQKRQHWIFFFIPHLLDVFSAELKRNDVHRTEAKPDALQQRLFSLL